MASFSIDASSKHQERSQDNNAVEDGGRALPSRFSSSGVGGAHEAAQNVTSIEDVQLTFEGSPSSRNDETLEQGMFRAPSSFLLNLEACPAN